MLSQVDFFWAECLWALEELIDSGQVSKNITRHILTFWTGGTIVCKTVSHPDHVRGDSCDVLFIEEAAFTKKGVWAVVAPMLLDTDGTAWLMSTPNRKNWFYKMYLRAKADITGRWFTIHVTSHDNPYLSPVALEEISQDLTEDGLQQEVFAMFLEGSGQVFRNIRANLWDPSPKMLQKHKEHRLVAGIDWYQKNNYTAISIGCADCEKELILDRVQGMTYPAQLRMIKAHYERWGMEILAEANSMGQPQIDQMHEDDVPVIGWDMTNKSKNGLVKGLQLALERETWKWLDNDVATGELEAWEMTVTSAGNMTYSAPSGVNDDTIIARMLMMRQAVMGTFTLG